MHNGLLQILHMLPAFQSTTELLEECRRHTEISPTVNRPVAPLQQSIQLHNVTFSYAQSPDINTIIDVTLRIPAGRITAVVGPSGAGKSTLVDLLLTTIQPSQGSVQVDDKLLDESQFAAWRAMIGYVPQETWLFHGSIRDNLLWSRPGASAFEINEALASAAAFDFVHNLPEGIDTIVGDRGVRLSGGERQRIALARALLRKPSLLILDEATSALDAENQQQIKDAVQKLRGKLTVVTVAHRLSTIQDADQIVVLDAGRIVETGTFEELSSQSDSRLSGLMRSDRSETIAA
ncbi:MAG: ATP-binding cassette domain-containing protein [Planctomycetaceae bacterium]